jgi:hypothetical protein
MAAGAAISGGVTARPWYVQAIDATLLANIDFAPRMHAGGAALAVGARDRLVHWPREVMRLVVKYQQNPLRAARSLSHAQVAMHDAWLHALERTGSAAAAEVAAHRAAALVLEQLYPNETPGQLLAQFASITARAGEGAPHPVGLAIGRQVADAIVRRSLTDGAGRVWPVKSRPAAFDGMWQPAPPINAVNPAEGMAPHWRTWVPRSKERYDPPTAPRPSSAAYAHDVREVLDISRSLTEAQRAAAEAWNLDAGSVTPGGVWMSWAIQQALSTSDPADLDPRSVHRDTIVPLTTLAVALLDAFIDCWRVKLRDWSERPITAVRRTLDPAFTPALVTPGFPSYVSGHATVSAAAATVLSRHWPQQTTRLDAMAQEAAMSRLWGGIHFRSDNDEGLRLGRSVARDVLAALTPA